MEEGREAQPQGPPWILQALRDRAHLACSLPGIASRTTQVCTSFPLISFYEKSTVRAELLYHCCYCFLITPPSFLKLRNQIKSSQPEINLWCNMAAWKTGPSALGWQKRRGRKPGLSPEARREAGLRGTLSMGESPLMGTHWEPGPGWTSKIAMNQMNKVPTLGACFPT